VSASVLAPWQARFPDLIYYGITHLSQIPLVALIILAATYTLQAVIFIVRRKWEHIGWMVIYILAIPVFSFWQQDNFSWGNTCVVVGEKSLKKHVLSDNTGFNLEGMAYISIKEHIKILSRCFDQLVRVFKEHVKILSRWSNQ
jgi:hypothetical protein